MNHCTHKISVTTTSVFLLFSLCWNTLYAQSVPAHRGNAGTASIDSIQAVGRELSSRPTLDSLDLRQLEINLEKAESEFTQTNFLHRLIPEVHLSASYGLGNLLFIDPNSTTTYITPKESYRLSLSLSLSDLFFSSKHSDALHQLQLLQTQYQHRKRTQMITQQTQQQELQIINDKISSLETEASMITDLLHFNELRFEQGKIEYDVLIRTKIELLTLQININSLKCQRFQLLLKNESLSIEDMPK